MPFTRNPILTNAAKGILANDYFKILKNAAAPFGQVIVNPNIDSDK